MNLQVSSPPNINKWFLECCLSYVCELLAPEQLGKLYEHLVLKSASILNSCTHK
jgi:hypothetical protein